MVTKLRLVLTHELSLRADYNKSVQKGQFQRVNTQLRFGGYGKSMEDWELGEGYITKSLWQCKRRGHLDMIGSGAGTACDFAFEAASEDPRAPSTSLSLARSRLR